MKVVLGTLAVIVLMIIAPNVMAHSIAYNDGYRQGIADFMHGRIDGLISNPTGNPNIVEFLKGQIDGWNDIFSGPLMSDQLFSKRSAESTDGWIDGATALVHGFPGTPLGQHSQTYIQAFYRGYSPSGMWKQSLISETRAVMALTFPHIGVLQTRFEPAPIEPSFLPVTK